MQDFSDDAKKNFIDDLKYLFFHIPILPLPLFPKTFWTTLRDDGETFLRFVLNENIK